MNIPLKKYLVYTLCILLAMFVIEGYSLMNALPFDDSYILLVYARNFSKLFSISFNPGTTDAGLTSPLYMMLLSTAGKINGNLFTTSFILGKFFYFISALLHYLIARHLCRCTVYREWAGLAAAAIWLTNGIVAFNSLSGMESVFFTFLVLSLVCIVVFPERIRLMTGLISGCLVLTRPDGWLLVLPVIFILSFEHFKDKRISNLLPEISVLALLSLPWMLYCFSHNGTLFPNTVIAKAYPFNLKDSLGFVKELLFSFQGNQVWYNQVSGEPVISSHGLLSFIPWVLIPPLYFLFTRKMQRINLLLLYLLFHTVFYFFKHPFPGELFRYFLFDLAVIILFSSVMIFELAGMIRKKYVDLAGTAALLLICVLLSLQLSKMNYYQSLYSKLNIQTHNQHNIIGYWLNNYTEGDVVIGLRDIGAIKYISNRKIVDLVGLLDPSVIEYRDGRLDDLIQKECDYVVDYTNIRPWGFTPSDTTLYEKVKACPTGRLYRILKESSAQSGHTP